MDPETRTGVLPYLRWIVGAETTDALDDALLLERFLRAQDEAAFAALLKRHGPMVLGVCRRVLNDADDADDAFQATFFVLVRKAAAIGKREALGSWLYKVAYRTALRARSAASRRRAEERKVAAMPASEIEPDRLWSDVRPLLDEELDRLPEKYRTPMVLCYLEGKTKEEAARELGWPAGTVSGRLARARELLRRRLSGRGVTATAGALTAAVLENSASASVPMPLAMSTLQAAVLIAAGKSAAAGAIAAPAVALTEGVVQAMFVTKMKIAALLVAAVAVLGTSAGMMTYQALAGDDPAAGSGQGGSAAQAPSGAPMGSGGGSAAATGQTKPSAGGGKDSPRPKPHLTNRELRQKLQGPATSLDKGIDNGTPLKDALDFISEANGVTIRIDHNAFIRFGGGAGEGGPVSVSDETPVTLKPAAKGTTLGNALNDMLAQMQPPATFLVKGGQIVIVPYQPYMNPDNGRDPPQEVPAVSALLREPVQVAADDIPLADALRDIAEATGANIIIDVRLKEKAKVPVTAHLQHVPLETAVRLLSDMADVKAVALDNVLYVTTKENADKIRQEEVAKYNNMAGGGGGLGGLGLPGIMPGMPGFGGTGGGVGSPPTGSGGGQSPPPGGGGTPKGGM
jgi:RNA polymerase sigma factor (sigma-70 family)